MEDKMTIVQCCTDCPFFVSTPIGWKCSKTFNDISHKDLMAKGWFFIFDDCPLDVEQLNNK